MPISHTAVPCIEAKNVHYQYGDNVVLDHVSFRIATGDYVGILGPNGSGKTTLLRIILGILKPTSGSVRVFGEELRYFKNSSWIGYVPQRAASSGQGFPATVEEVVASGRTPKIGMLHRMHAQDKAAIEQAMKTADVARLRSRLISRLSGGERQRVFIARALAAEPKVLILDEPTVGVDIGAQEKFYSFLRAMNENGMTILLVSHDIDVLAGEAKTILCLNRELVCHVAAQDFITSDHLTKLYGEKGKFILHKH
jgi:zinc transport system ATP-binding protein